MAETAKKYNRTARALHWISALTIIGLFALGWWMVDLTYYSEWYKVAPQWHKSIGFFLFLATSFRLLWKIITRSPAIEGKAWEMSAAKTVHGLLYILLFSLFVSGYLISTADGRPIEIFNWFYIPGFGSFIENQEDIAGNVHFYVACTVIGLALIHALAAFKHHFINKDSTLNKML
jgi:cytochrome b561